MTARRRTFLVVLLALGAVLAGCGGDQEGKPLPTATATALNSQLDNIQDRLNNGTAGACRDIIEGPRDPNLGQVRELLGSMPDDVDPDVRSALEDSFNRLWELVGNECDARAAEEERARQERRQQEEEQQPEETDTSTETTPTETTPTETEPTDTTPTTPTSPEEVPLPNDGDGNSGGAVPGGNNGGGAGAGQAEGQ